MARFTAVLDDADSPGSVVVASRFDARSTAVRLSGGDEWSVTRRTSRGGVSTGVEVIDLSSGPLTVSVLPTRGMGLWKAMAGDVPVGWNSPVRRPVHPQFVDQSERNGLGWLDGFNELLCRCGLAFNGPPGHDDGARSPIESQLTLHGRIANLPAHRVELTIDDTGDGRISITGVVEECTLFGPQLRLTSTVSIVPGQSLIHVEDRVENLASTPAELELLYHINVGPPFLGAGSRLVVPAETVVPRDVRAAEGIDSYAEYLPPTPGYAEQAYFFDLREDRAHQTAALLRNAAGDRGFSLRWNKSQLPCFTQWKCTQPDADGYVTGLEPGTNFPNFKAFERSQGRVRLLQPGEAWQGEFTIGVQTTAAAVDTEEVFIRACAGDRPTTILQEPSLPYCRMT
jgi:hypothetical protein